MPFRGANLERGEDMAIMEILENAMYKRQELIITTKSRGEIRGIPNGLDDFITDSERLGYFIGIGKHEEDVVFLDEIADISAVVPIKTLSDWQTIEDLSEDAV